MGLCKTVSPFLSQREKLDLKLPTNASYYDVIEKDRCEDAKSKCSKILYNILGFGDELFRTVFAGDYIVGTKKTCDHFVGTKKTCDHFVGNEKSLRPFCWHPNDGDDLTATKRRRPMVVHPFFSQAR